MKTILLTLMIGLFFSPALSAATNTQVIPDVSLKSKTEPVKGKLSRQQTTTFQQHEIADSPAVNLSELFQQEQSTVRLTNNSGDATQTALSIRGFGDNAAANTLILVDGFPLTNPSLLAPNFNSIPLSDIKRIDIFQGSKGSLWGDQAVGGVINIITRHPEKLFADSVLSVGSYHSNYFNVIAGDQFNHGIFMKAFGVLAKTDNYRDHNQIRGDNIAAQIGMDDAHGTTLMNVQAYHNTTDFPGGLSQQQMDQNPRQASDFNNYSAYHTNVVQLLNKHDLSADWLLETRLSQHATDGSGRIFIDFTRRDSTLGFDPRLLGSIRGTKIILGYDGQISQFKLYNSKVQSHTTAKQNDLYLQAVAPLAPAVDFTIGARGALQANTIEAAINQPLHATNKVFVSEQGITYHPENNLSIYLRRDGNFSFPKANEEISAANAQEMLHVQTGVSYESGAEWKDETARIQLNIFHLALNNEIAFNPQQTPARPFGAWSNLDKTRRDGVTLSLDNNVTTKATLKSQLNYVNARFAEGTYSGHHIPAVPAITGNAGLDYNWPEHWQAKYFLTYTGTRFASEDDANTGAKLSSYWLNNAAIQYSYSFYLVSFEVMNVFNQTYTSYAYYNPDNGANVYYPAPGRNFLLSLKVNLD